MQRFTEELKVRCKSVINDKQVIYLIKESSSSSATYEMVLMETSDPEKAKAGR